MIDQEYYIGLDCGTDSVGFVVTDTEYKLIKVKGRTMWGSHLFDAASTAQDRRMHRTARRRTEREKKRIMWTQSMFADAIAEIDPQFFIRLNDSAYHLEDKGIEGKDSLFHDPGFCDKDFSKRYPTIYHLRCALMESDDPADFDPRFVYLAVAHIMRHRGHFLFPGTGVASVMSISEPLYDDELGIDDGFIASVMSISEPLYDLSQMLYDTLEVNADFSNANEIKEVLQAPRREKKKLLPECLHVDDKTVKDSLVKMLLGNKVDVAKFFSTDEYKDLPRIEFSKMSFEETDMPVLEEALDPDHFAIITQCKAIYDWSLLSGMLDGCAYLSQAKVKLFNRNKEELARLKRVVKRHAPSSYDEFFHGTSDKLTNFVSYIGKDHDRKLKKQGLQVRVKRCSTDDFYKTISKLLPKDAGDDEDLAYILDAIEEKRLLVLLQSYRNGVFPNQLVKADLERILANASRFLPFLTEKDADGKSIVDKLLCMVSFRVPYYVGPLGHGPVQGNAWAVRLMEGEVLPWKFDAMVDEAASEEGFIRRMTRKCTYLKDQDVLPKNSLLYSAYMVLNDLNNVRLKGELLSVEQKQVVFNELFMTKERVTRKAFCSFAVKKGWLQKDESDEVSGFDGDFKSSLAPFIKFKPYIGKGRLGHDDVEEIIKWLTLFSEGGKVVKRRLEEAFKDKLTEDEINTISMMKFSGWGRFSHKFLSGIVTTDPSTGEMKTVIRMLWDGQDNLMQLLSQDYEFYEQTVDDSHIESLSHDVIDDLHASPAVKKQVWQSLRIVDELIHIMGHKPAKLFIEVARGPEDDKKGKRTRSRKENLLEAMKKGRLTDEDREIIASLESTDESLVSKRDRLYLYYSQMGRCMYSGEPINIDDLDNKNLYDIDHIYPISKSNDDSLTNRVLVCSNLNRDKSATFPIQDSIRDKMTPYWKMLKDKGLINEEKLRRLTRTSPLSEEDLKGFIARQLVETRQSTKITADVLKRFLGDDCKVVYSKAGPVAEFRDKFKFPKCRTINNLHHAKDAYLNIVVGNVLDTKYTANFFMASEYGTGYYNIDKPFDSDVKGAWKISDGGSIKTVRAMMAKNNIMLTRQPEERCSDLFNLQLVKAGSKNGVLPAKSSDPKLRKLLDEAYDKAAVIEAWTKRYGGYNSLSISFFAVVEYVEKKKTYVCFVPIKTVDRKRLTTSESIKAYCEEELGYKDVTVIRTKVLMNTPIELNGFRLTLTGKQNASITLETGIPLILGDDSITYVKHIERLDERLKADKNYVVDPKYDQISKEGNERLYEVLTSKALSKIYTKKPNNKGNAFEAAKDKFSSLSLIEQVRLLTNFLLYFNGNGRCDLTLIGESAASGILTMSIRFVKGSVSFEVIDQSITGFYERRLKLS